MTAKVGGLVIGTRKSGTTWLYENFRTDPNVAVSEVVKESGFFSGRRGDDPAKYDALISAAPGAVPVEVDTSICYAADATDRIKAYNPAMRLVLILRKPADFLASRYTHGLRKGDLAQDNVAEALAQEAWLRSELDYAGIIARFARFHDRGQLAIMQYEAMNRDPIAYYDEVRKALGVQARQPFTPDLQPVNPSRDSRLPIVSVLLSKGAFAARKMGLDGLVNRAKGTGVHRVFEKTNDPEGKERLTAEAQNALDQLQPGSDDFYSSIFDISPE